MDELRKKGETLLKEGCVLIDTSGRTRELKEKSVLGVASKKISYTILMNSSEKTKIICFIDDDVTINKGYFEEILRIFNDYQNAFGVSIYNRIPKQMNEGKIDILMKKIFFLSVKRTTGRI